MVATQAVPSVGTLTGWAKTSRLCTGVSSSIRMRFATRIVAASSVQAPTMRP
jgi:hypothetical protein